jgi:hypothetical protein
VEERGLASFVRCNISPPKKIAKTRRTGVSKLSGTTVPSRLVRACGVPARVRRVAAGYEGWECQRVRGVV